MFKGTVQHLEIETKGLHWMSLKFKIVGPGCEVEFNFPEARQAEISRIKELFQNQTEISVALLVAGNWLLESGE
jgi:hypothetical protein